MNYGATIHPWFIYDDSYITLSNALAFLGYNSNYTSPALTGATSIVHVILVAAIASIAPAEFALGLSNALATYFFVYGLVRLAEESGLTRLLTTSFGLLGCSTAFTALHLYNGLETGLALAAITWSLVFLTRNQLLPLSLICATLPWIRPELIAWSAISIGMFFYANRKKNNLYRELGYSILILTLATLPFLILCWVNTGHPIPLTISAKKFFFAENCAPLEWRNEVAIKNMAAWINGFLFVSIGMTTLPFSTIGRGILLFITIFITTYWLTFPGALGHYDQRYLHILIPFALFSTLKIIEKAKTKHILLAYAITAILLTQNISTNIPNIQLRAADGREFSQNHLAEVSRWINNHTPPEAKIIAHDAGYIGYKAQRHLIDFVGLKTPSAIPFHQRHTSPSCGKERTFAISEIIRTTNPSYLIILNEWDKIFNISTNIKDQGINLEQVFHDNFGYSIYKITIFNTTPPPPSSSMSINTHFC